MPDTARAQQLLALFTSPESAEGIVGDLTECRDDGGPVSFWRHVLATTVGLWGNTFSGAPLATLGLVAAGCVLFASSALGGIAVVRLFPDQLGPAVDWILLSSLWWGGAVCTGALLVGVAQLRGMAACIALAITAEALLVVFGVTVRSPSPVVPNVVFFPLAALAPLPLLTGAIIVRLRLIARGNRNRAVGPSQ